jgi:hypothetical protein
MSDDNDKIVRVTDFVLPAEDFGERIASVFEEAPPEAVVDSVGEIVGEVRINRCGQRFGGLSCELRPSHSGMHRNSPNGVSWNDGDSDSVDPPPVRKLTPSPSPAGVAGNYLTSAQIMAYAKRESAPIVDYTRQQPLKPKKPWTVNLGMPNGSMILPGLAVTVTEQMQIVFRAKQIICAPSGGKLYITGVFVGNRVQLMQWSGNGMLMDFLKERTDVDFDTAEPGINIAFNVINRGDTPGTFDITLFGEAAT